MSTFNINRIIKKHDLDYNALAKELFPKNKYPLVALNRVVEGVSFLDTNQISILATIVGVEVSELFSSDTWGMKMSNEDTIKFFKNNYRVELDLVTLVTKIFCDDRMIANETLIFEKNVKLSEYINRVNETIINLNM